MPNFRDHTDKLDKWQQLPARSLPHAFRVFLDDVHRAWEFQWQERLEPAEGVAQEVFPGIWVGSELARFDESFISTNKIASILNMAVEINYEPWPELFVAKVGIDDGIVAPPHAFERAALEIHLAREQDRNVFVHCAAGISRSVTAVIAYLMIYKGFGFTKALNMIRKSRPQANPHPHLVRSLMRDLGPKFVK